LVHKEDIEITWLGPESCDDVDCFRAILYAYVRVGLDDWSTPWDPGVYVHEEDAYGGALGEPGQRPKNEADCPAMALDLVRLVRGLANVAIDAWDKAITGYGTVPRLPSERLHDLDRILRTMGELEQNEFCTRVTELDTGDLNPGDEETEGQ
jgi:hypothetical protein